MFLAYMKGHQRISPCTPHLNITRLPQLSMSNFSMAQSPAIHALFALLSPNPEINLAYTCNINMGNNSQSPLRDLNSFTILFPNPLSLSLVCQVEHSSENI